MQTFAFLVHPLNIDDVAKKYKIARRVSPKVVAQVLKHRPPFVMAEVEKITSLTGAEAKGWFIVVPLLPWQFKELDEDYVLEKIAKACKVAKKQGAKLVGLGAFTAVVGNGGKGLLPLVDIPITTGNTYTTTTAIQGTMRAAQIMDIKVASATLVIVGATGSIGKACARIMAPRFASTILIGRHQAELDKLKLELEENCPEVIASTNLADVGRGDVIITVTSATDAIIEPRALKPGSIICDVARPRDVSKAIYRSRDDVLVIDGGIVELPGRADLNLDLGPPSGMCEGCVGETIILALEGRYENYTIGRNISVEKVEEMAELAEKHGFKLSGLRRFEAIITEEQIQQVKSAVSHRPLAI